MSNLTRIYGGLKVHRSSAWVADCGADNDPERIANANLIAAAPDLLAACKEAMFAWAHGVGSVTTSDDPDVRANADRNTREGKRIMRLIADAIAKAEGGAG